MRLLLKEAEPVFLNGNNLEYFFRTKTWNIYTYEQQENDERVFSEAKLINKLGTVVKRIKLYNELIANAI